MNNKLSVRASAAPWHNGVELLVVSGKHVGTDIVMSEAPANTIISPTVTIGNKQAQTLMDDLWMVGFRPSEETGSVGSLRRTEKHLEDMRQIAFRKMAIEKPGESKNG